MKAYHAVTFGEGLLRLTTQDDALFSESRALSMHVGGSEANVAVGMARLGLRTAWLSRLADDAVGRYIEAAIAAGGAEVRHVTWTAEGRNGLYFLEEAPEPRTSNVLYDRDATAFARLPADAVMLPAGAVGPGTVLHASGINLALGANVVRALRQLVEATQRAGGLFSFDTNVRDSLVDPDDGAEPFLELMSLADVLFVPGRDARRLRQLATEEPKALFGAVHAAHPSAVLAMTFGAQGAAAAGPGEAPQWTPAIPTGGRHRIGRGDAFVAAFLAGHLTHHGDVETALRWGAAGAALKATIPGDLPLFDRWELERLADPHREPTGLRR